MADDLLLIEDTPNPHALKFVAPGRFTADPAVNIRSYRQPEDAAAAGDALARAIFTAGPVVSVMITDDFVTVNKKPTARWPKLRPKIEAILREHLGS